MQTEDNFTDKPHRRISGDNEAQTFFVYRPFTGYELLLVYEGFKNKTFGHLCEACDHCSLICQDLAYGGGMHRGAGWCWHGVGVAEGVVIPENCTGVCLQACKVCLGRVCQFHFALRMIATQYNLPRDMIFEIAKHVPIPCDVTVWEKISITETRVYHVAPDDSVTRFQVDLSWVE